MLLESLLRGQKRLLGDTSHELLSPLTSLELMLGVVRQRTSELEWLYLASPLRRDKLVKEGEAMDLARDARNKTFLSQSRAAKTSERVIVEGGNRN